MLLMVLDSSSSASFVSERLSQSLHLPRFRQGVQISGIAGLSHDSPLQAVASLTISAVRSPLKKFKVTGIVVPRATCDLPLHPIFLFDVETFGGHSSPSLLKLYVRAGGVVLLALCLSSRQNLVGSSLESAMSMPQVTPLPG